APVFSFAKLHSVDTGLGPEMKSTGEVMGRDLTFNKALYKALLSSGMQIPHHGVVLATIADKDKNEAIPLLKNFAALGFKIIATEGTAKLFKEHHLDTESVKKINEGTPNVLSLVDEKRVNIVINTISSGKKANTDGFLLRRKSVEKGIICLTSLDTVKAFLLALESITFSTYSLPQYHNAKPQEKSETQWIH
ncbi:MAG: hypothetical protein KBD63_06585, partial [Bacteriovoracaceae bacterium]|nr:hypothetical protein [Bacteriovoracaceae bacterium]